MKYINILPLIALLLTGCTDNNEYKPKGEFYAKTSPSRGDAGVSEVISVEIEKATYEGEDEITVPTTVGFGHLPSRTNEEEQPFCVHCYIEDFSDTNGYELAWETRVWHEDSFYSEKYNSTEPKNGQLLFIPLYGQFYPTYTEQIDFVYPADSTEGRATVEIDMVYGDVLMSRFKLEFKYLREGNKLSFIS